MSNQNKRRAGPGPIPPAPSPELGLRARKKQKTRLAISDVATRLFVERGFDNVTIAEVAAAAEVSVNTVFNYFGTKEELFFDRGAELAGAPSRVVAERKRGESAVAALRRNFRKLVKSARVAQYGQRTAPFLRTIEQSPALQARARLLMQQSEAQLLATLRQEAGAGADEVDARAVAAMVTGVYAMLLRAVHHGVLRGVPDAQLQSELTKLGERAFELLLRAAGDYCIKD